MHNVEVFILSLQPQNEIAEVLKRVEALEKKQHPTADDLKKEIIQYALRQATDFDKYQALEKAEHLKFFARESKDKRADDYATVHSTLLERINRPGSPRIKK